MNRVFRLMSLALLLALLITSVGTRVTQADPSPPPTVRSDDTVVAKHTDPHPSPQQGGKPILSITNNPNSYDFEVVYQNGTSETGLTEFSVTNNSEVAVDITISGTDMTGGETWTLDDDGNPGDKIYGLKAGLEGGSYDIVVNKSGSYKLVTGLDVSEIQRWGLKLFAPTTFYDEVQKEGTVTLTATEP